MIHSFAQTDVFEVDSAKNFVDIVQSGLMHINEVVPRLIFRGVGDSHYELTPSALRKDDYSRKRLKKLSSITTAFDINTRSGQVMAEAETLRLFYQIADKHGLTLPSVPPEIHAALSGSVNDISVMRLGGLLHTPDRWPDPALRPILALAQHYGLPTRLLDWSIDPFVAMYFAAERGTYHLENLSKNPPNNQPPTHIGVWQTASNLLSDIGFGRKAYQQLDVVHAPRGGNPNLAAQKGLFTIFAESPDLTSTNIDHRPLNEIVAHEFENPDTGREAIIKLLKAKLGSTKLFQLYELPIEQAPSLLSILHRKSYDAARIFPGFGGVASAVENLGRLTAFSK
jgi:hypothetical protein